MKHRSLFHFATLVCTSFVFAQPSPGVGNAVLLATNSIQIDRDSAVLSGDIIVNNATSGPVLGQKALSLDRNTSTPAGYKLAATSIALDQGVVVGGDVYYNTLTNDGTIAGASFTPLALPVFATLPPALVRPAGSSNVAVPDAGLRTLDEGAYGDLVIGRGARVRLSGGTYGLRSSTIPRVAERRFARPAHPRRPCRPGFG